MKKKLPAINYQLSTAVVLSAISYLSTVALAEADQPSARTQATASLQSAPTWKPQGREPLEKYDNPPAPARKIETSLRMVSPFGPFTSYQVNVDASGNNIVGDAANEPCITVDPTNPTRM